MANACAMIAAARRSTGSYTHCWHFQAVEGTSQLKIVMPFQPVSMHSIRSSNQRALATHWNALASDRGFPAIGAFNPQATGHSPEQMIVWDVESAGEAGSSCFRVRKVGLRAVEAIGDSPIGPIGKTMEELAPPPLREISLNGARECVASGCAIYEIITTVDANAHVVECERLLLPFGDGEHVEQIVASLQLISFQGAIERQGFARDFVGRPQLTFAGMILSDAMARRRPSAIAARVSQGPQANGATAHTQAASDRAKRQSTVQTQQPASRQAKGSAAHGPQDRTNSFREIQRDLHGAGHVRDRRGDRSRSRSERARQVHARARDGIGRAQLHGGLAERPAARRQVRLRTAVIPGCATAGSRRPGMTAQKLTSSASAGP